MGRILVVSFFAVAAWAQGAGGELSQARIDEIISRFAAKEAEFA